MAVKEPKPQAVIISEISDDLILTWQTAPEGASLGAGYVDTGEFTYSGMLITGALDLHSGDTSWNSIPGDWYDHKGNYKIDGSTESRPHFDSVFDQPN